MAWLVDLFSFFIERPFVFIMLVILPLLVIARVRRVYPTRLLLLTVVVPTVLSMVTVVFPAFVYVVVGFDLLILIVLLIDLFLIAPQHRFDVVRRIERIMSLGKSQNVELELINRSKRTWQIGLVDDLPEDFAAEPPAFSTGVGGQSRTQFDYRLVSQRRGLFSMAGVHLRVRSRLGLWNAYYLCPLPAEVNVYPDLKQISEFGILARTNRLSLLGVRRTRRIGQDNEFERLRDYSRDDSHRFIDWRASARKQKLMVKDFQANQNQTIVFLVDCGRMMTGQSGKFNMLDHALNAMLLMSYVALKQGDSVGMLTFSNRVHRYTPPRSGTAQLNRLLHASFDQHASYVESRYDDAFFHLNKNCRKRSLVVLITNLIDEINSSQVESYLLNMRGKHLPLGVFLRDHDLYDPIENYLNEQEERPSQNGRAARQTLFAAAAAGDIASWRQQTITSLAHQGVLMLDVFPEELTAELVNRYLDIKARHLL